MCAVGHYPEIRLYNTLTRSADTMRPLEPGKVGVYCCGPTVYNYQHIGNLRTYVFEDLLVRTLRYAGYQVKHVMNITDVGHLVSDADEGEDKMALAAKREGRSSRDIADYYTKIYFDHCAKLNILCPDVVCKATEHIEQMIDLVKRLEDNGIAYVSGGNVYYDVSKFPEYGKLAGLDLSSLKAGARIEVDEQKRNVQDFVLWFTKSKFENQELQWDSPWGRGYPGWHIECSAMSMSYLGEEFDIHCGGIDHIPVHHTNEIAQSEGATGRQFAQFWLHGGFLVVDKEKMAKSTGGFLTLDDVIEQGYDPLSYRFLCLGGSYRQELSWSWRALDAAANGLKKLRNQVISWKAELEASTSADGELTSEIFEEHKRTFDSAVFADLNMARAVAVLHNVAGDSRLEAKEKLRLFSIFDAVLGLGVDGWQAEEEDIPEEVQQLARNRDEARRNRDWESADQFRDQIASFGYVVEDTKDGPIVRRK